MDEATGLHREKSLRVTVPNVLIQKRGDKFGLRARVKIVCCTFVLLLEALMGLLKVASTRALSDERLTLVSIEICRFLQEHPFKLLLVQLTRVLANFDEHLNR